MPWCFALSIGISTYNGLDWLTITLARSLASWLTDGWTGCLYRNPSCGKTSGIKCTVKFTLHGCIHMARITSVCSMRRSTISVIKACWFECRHRQRERQGDEESDGWHGVALAHKYVMFLSCKSPRKFIFIQFSRRCSFSLLFFSKKSCRIHVYKNPHHRQHLIAQTHELRAINWWSVCHAHFQNKIKSNMTENILRVRYALCDMHQTDT